MCACSRSSPEDQCSAIRVSATGSRKNSPIAEVTNQNNQLDQAFATHQNTNGKALPPDQLRESRGEGAANDLSKEGYRQHANHVGPGDARVQQTEVGAQARQGKVEGQEEHGDEILDLLGQLDGKPTVVRADQADQEAAEDRMDSDDAGKPGRGQDHQQRQGDDRLGRAVLNAAGAP